MKKIFYYALCFIFVFSFACNKATNNSKMQKTIYLTFDDGPCPNTLNIIKTLNTFKVKATFFIVGTMAEKYPDIVKEIYNNNHKIGLHSYSHIYKQIYKDKITLTNDIMLCRKAITNILPTFNTNLYRFPGGSFNVRQEYKTLVNELGFYFYDWNASTLDSEKNYTPYQIFCNTKQTSKNKNQIILLCHDLKTNTFLALHDIIKYFLQQGYTFKTL